MKTITPLRKRSKPGRILSRIAFTAGLPCRYGAEPAPGPGPQAGE